MPTFWEAVIGAAASWLVAFLLLSSPASIAPFLFGSVLAVYALLRGLSWLIGKVIP